MLTQRLILLILIASPASAAQPLRQVMTIDLPNVQGRIDHMDYDDDAHRLYVSALGNNTLEVIDTQAGKVIRTITGLAAPQGVRVVPREHRVYVANARDGVCHIYDDRTYRQIGTIDLKSNADNVRYDAQANRIYIGDGNGALAGVDAHDGKLLADIKLPVHPESFQLEAHGSRIFVNLPRADSTIAVIDRQKGAVVQTWSIADAKVNFPMALDEEDHRLFIGYRNPPKLVVIDTDSGKSLAALDCVRDTDDLWYDASARRIYVTGGEGAISIINSPDKDHYAVVGRFATAPGARTSFFDPGSRMLFVAVPHRGAQNAQIRSYTANPSR